jgi:hypothetical protein
MCFGEATDFRRSIMISCSRRILSAIVVAAALLTTVAVASNVHKHAADQQDTTATATTGRTTYDRTFGSAAGRISPFILDGNFACPLGYVDCATLEMQLPQ